VKEPYKEALRYIRNAEELLASKAGRENGVYIDRKYVRMAGNTAWNGVLIAIGGWLEGMNIKYSGKTRPSEKWYEKEISKRNRKLNTHFTNAYDILHKSMGYDGVLLASISKEGLKVAHEIIILCNRHS